ncbi:poly-beta-1,6-N-acetyl-D-glucosamine biosynthesis protein PgaD [Rosenbergiella epipactidis]|uniref:poly-beta-1,6-N-acetyl-D-glucosamine biosynthesis protein PgaD n=1 Tax=Rosenbergiella epipactidis TaxID=1544694 RepID=UPI001BD954AC|nr:poly-beta-1,6-N-acetyl-D-glucosamine biosynthesis protein PgaD [Rosenbergiella epipactidis]MBT0717997.1 poly-beta-1,6-N-acetyl-D-glucosamine biosynthesis protein PgaD [Rosenbergiella epipactidis]
MNSQPIIITEPRRSIRIVDSILTLIAWGGFLYLIIHEYQQLFSRQYRPEVSPAITLLNYFLFAIIYVLLFILWAKYNQLFFSRERRKRKGMPNQRKLAKSFAISIAELEKLESHKVIKVFHSPSGEITQSEIIMLSAEP